jgi:hypothetical protein
MRRKRPHRLAAKNDKRERMDLTHREREGILHIYRPTEASGIIAHRLPIAAGGKKESKKR